MASAAVESVSSLDRRLWAWARSHPYTIVAAPILLAFLVSYLLSPRSDWVSVYLPAARRLLAGQEVFQEGYVYPPFMALLAVPLLSLPPLLERLAWWALNAVCLVLMCRWAWRLAGGSALEGSPPAPWQEHAIWGAGLLTGVLHAFNCLSNQQTDLVIGALLLAGCLALQQGRSLRAATWLGLAAAMKCTPLLWVMYFLAKRRWSAAAWLVTVAVGANLLPDLVSSAPSGRPQLLAWYDRCLSPLREPNYTPGEWATSLHLNQALAGAVNRMWVSEWQWVGNRPVVQRRADAVDSATLRHGLIVFEAILLLGSLALWMGAGRPESLKAESIHVLASSSDPHRNSAPLSPVLGGEGLGVRGSCIPCERTKLPRGILSPLTPTPLPPSTGGEGRGASLPPTAHLRLRQGLEFSMVLALMLLLSPISSKAHFGTLLLPGFCIARAICLTRNGLLGAIFVVANVLGTLALGWWGAYVSYVGLYSSFVTWKCLLLLLACGVAIVLLRRGESLNRMDADKRIAREGGDSPAEASAKPCAA